MWDCLENNINNILNNMCPIRNLIVPETKPDWLTNEKEGQDGQKSDDTVLMLGNTKLDNVVTSERFELS